MWYFPSWKETVKVHKSQCHAMTSRKQASCQRVALLFPWAIKNTQVVIFLNFTTKTDPRSYILRRILTVTRVLEPADILRCEDLSWRSEQKQDSAVLFCCLHDHRCNCVALGSALQSSPCYVSGFRSLGAHDALFKPGWKYMKSCLKHGAHHWIKKQTKTPTRIWTHFLFFSASLKFSPDSTLNRWQSVGISIVLCSYQAK